MRKLFLSLSVGVLFCLTVAAQKISKPTLTPSELTASQKQVVQEGVGLHDQRLYDEAIKKYEQVLKENPDSDVALYEMGLSYYNKKDFPKTLEIGYQLVRYKSKMGLLGYLLIANVFDDQGKPKEAIALYQSAIKQLEGDTEFESHLSSLFYNLGVTYARQKQFKESREVLKKAVQYDFQYASPNALLAEIFYGTKYKVPALLAASRLITLELGSPRSERAVAIIQDVLRGGVSQGKNPNDIQITLNPDSPKDEGDFTSLEMILGLSKVGTDITNEDKNKTQEEKFADQVESFISFLETDEKTKTTFVGKNYYPFMIEMKRRGYARYFAYLVLQQSGNQAAEKWLDNNSEKAIEFINWARKFQN